MIVRLVASLLMVSTLALASCSKPAAVAGAGADLIITGGPILTMEGAEPTTAEAIVVDDGKIAFVGSKVDALKRKHDGTVVRDLAGKTLMPGFIDGHAHAMQFGAQAVGANLLAPPDGNVNTIDDVVEKLKAFAQSPDVKRTGWIFGVGYDDALLGRHPCPSREPHPGSAAVDEGPPRCAETEPGAQPATDSSLETTIRTRWACRGQASPTELYRHR